MLNEDDSQRINDNIDDIYINVGDVDDDGNSTKLLFLKKEIKDKKVKILFIQNLMREIGIDKHDLKLYFEKEDNENKRDNENKEDKDDKDLEKNINNLKSPTEINKTSSSNNVKDYSNGKIYLLLESVTKKTFYVGSTVRELNIRKDEHLYLAQNDDQRRVYKYIRTLGYNNTFYIELYENYSCANETELHKREGDIIRLLLTRGEKLTNVIISGKNNESEKLLIANSSKYYEKILSESTQRDIAPNISHNSNINYNKISMANFSCIFCKDSYEEAQLYRRHIRGHHMNNEKYDQEKVADELKRLSDRKVSQVFKCDKCPQLFSTKFIKNRHKCGDDRKTDKVIKIMKTVDNNTSILTLKEHIKTRKNELNKMNEQ